MGGARCSRARTASSGASRRASRGAWAPASPGSASATRSTGSRPKQDWQQVRLSVPGLGPAALQSRRPARQLDAPARGGMRRRRRACEAGLSLASRVLPLVTLRTGPRHRTTTTGRRSTPTSRSSTAPARRAFAFDMEGPVRFGNAPTFDSAALRHRARVCRAPARRRDRAHRYTPLDVADWLEDMADGCETALTRAKRAPRLRPPRGAAHHRRRRRSSAASPASSPSDSAPPAGPSCSSPPRSRR